VNVLSLCAGIGGLDLGLKLACPDARTVGYVEWEPYAACVLAERMAEGRLDACPIYCDDLRRFDAKQWAGAVDLVAAGFPCQPFSVAGKQRGMSDERWLWPAVFNVIRDSGATSCFLENVPPIVGKGGTSVLADIASLGWSAEWGMFRASDVGAPHRRERWFLLALADSDDARQRAGRWAVRDERDDARGRRDGVGDAHGDTTVSAERAERLGVERDALPRRERCEEEHRSPASGHAMGDTDGAGCKGSDELEGHAQFRFPPGFGTPREQWDGPEPAIRREAHGLCGRVESIAALGNAVVPQQAALAFHVLYERLMA